MELKKFESLEEYREYVGSKLNPLRKVFANASIGDYSEDVNVPEEEDEFTELYVGVQIMLEVIRDKIEELTALNDQLTGKVEEVGSIIESMGDGLLTIDRAGKISSINERGALMLGQEMKDAFGQPLEEVFRLENDQGFPVRIFNEPFQKVLEKTKKLSLSYNVLRKDEIKFPADITASPMRSFGKVEGAVIVFRDVTAAKEIDQAKSEFISIASHQLRTPLTTIGWYCEVLLSDRLGQMNEGQKKHIQEIYQAKNRMARLVSSLLHISRIEMGTFKVKIEESDARKVVSEIIADLTPKIQAKKLSIKEKIDIKEVSLNLGPNILRVTVQNLLSNAVKYTPIGGSISVELGLEEKEQSRTLTLKVSDIGLGIPKKDQNKVFTKFFRAGNVDVGDPESSGLGLYIVKTMLAKIGGQISFESEENKGSSFLVTIPVLKYNDRVSQKNPNS